MQAVGGAFPAEIYAGWPSLVRKLGIMYAILALGGALLQNNPKSFTGKVLPPRQRLNAVLFVRESSVASVCLLVWAM